MVEGRRRVVITGIGLVTPLGNDVSSTWDALLEGRSGVGEITQFDTDGHPMTIAGEVKEFDAGLWLDRKSQRKMDRFIHFSVATSLMALEDAGLPVPVPEPDRRDGGSGAGEEAHRVRDEGRGRGDRSAEA